MKFLTMFKKTKTPESDLSTMNSTIGKKPDDFLSMKGKSAAERETRWIDGGMKPWGVWNTSISEYAQPLKVDAEELVQRLALGSGCALKVLDVGMGTGEKWLPILTRLGGRLEFRATVLSKAYVREELCPLTEECDAVNLSKAFMTGSFDLILSHKGMHGQELEGFREIEKLLKLGGIAVVVVSPTTRVSRETIESAFPLIRVIDYALDKAGEAEAYLLVKRDSSP